MNAENIFGFVIYALVALLMMGIGIVQIKSRKPVAFYSGEKPPKAEELSDVSAWNRKHGMMWLAYGIIILISFLIGARIGDSVWAAVPMIGGVLIPVIFMIRYHNRLRKQYLRSNLDGEKQ